MSSPSEPAVQAALIMPRSVVRFHLAPPTEKYCKSDLYSRVSRGEAEPRAGRGLSACCLTEILREVPIERNSRESHRATGGPVARLNLAAPGVDPLISESAV